MRDLMEQLGLTHLPEYLKLTELPNGLVATVDLGEDTDEAKRRLEELISLEANSLYEVNADGPLDLQWERLSDPVARLLLVKGVRQIKVPDPRVDGVRGRLTGFILSTLRNLEGTDPLTLFGTPVRLRDVINTGPLTSRVVSLTKPASDELSDAARVLTGLNRHFEVPPALRAAVVKAYRSLRKRAGKIKKLRKKTRRKEEDERNASLAPESQNEEPEDSSSEMDDSDIEVQTDEEENEIMSIENEQDEDQVDSGVKSKYDSLPEDVSPRANAKCYVCNRRGNRTVQHKTPALLQYPRMCTGCAEFNWARRNARTNLTGYIAIVTGGRIKIG